MNTLSQISQRGDVSGGPISDSDSLDRSTRWSRTAIAALSPGQISFLPDETLAEVIDRAADFLPQPEVCDRLCYLDRDSLERLVHLVRQAYRRRGY